jgi:hypothetical protein
MTGFEEIGILPVYNRHFQGALNDIAVKGRVCIPAKAC